MVRVVDRVRASIVVTVQVVCTYRQGAIEVKVTVMVTVMSSAPWAGQEGLTERHTVEG